MGNFAETAGELDRLCKLCTLSSFNRRGAARKNKKAVIFIPHRKPLGI